MEDTGFITYMLVVMLIVGVIAVNWIVLTDKHLMRRGLFYAVFSKKTLKLFIPLYIICFMIVFINV